MEQKLMRGEVTAAAILDGAERYVDPAALQTAVDFYRKSYPSESLEHAERELVCDGADHINQLRYDVERGVLGGRFPELADLLDKVLDAVNRTANELTGGAFELDDAAGSGEAESVGADAGETGVRFSRKANVGGTFEQDKYFDSRIDNLKNENPSGRIRVGRLKPESPVVRAGMLPADVYFDVSKINKELASHGDHLTPSDIKKIPQLLIAPIVITDPSVRDTRLKNTVDLFGNMHITNGTPVMLGLTIAKDKSGQMRIVKVRTLHARGDYSNQITDASVLYLNEDKKRTKAWFHDRGIDVPLGGTKFGSIRSISASAQNSQEKFSRKVGGTLTEADVERILREYIDKYGAISPGENPTREVQVPKRTAEENKVSQTVRTVLEAKATPDMTVPLIEELIALDEYSYDEYSDKQAIADAEKEAENLGWDAAQTQWFKDIESGKVSKEITAMGWTLYNNAANSGNVALALDVLNAMVGHQRNAAQAVQATRILKQLDPQTRLYGVSRSVKLLQRDLKERYGDKAPGLKIDEGLAEAFIGAETEAERETALKSIYRDIGRQMPSRFIDKWNAWRYLAMLANPRTHIRNIVGNAAFAPVVATKNLIATGLEAAADKVSPRGIDRTKTLAGFGGKLYKAALADYAISA